MLAIFKWVWNLPLHWNLTFQVTKIYTIFKLALKFFVAILQIYERKHGLVSIIARIRTLHLPAIILSQHSMIHLVSPFAQQNFGIIILLRGVA